MVFSSLLILFLAISLSFWRGRTESEKATVTAAQLLEFHRESQRKSQETATALHEQWDKEREEWQRERREFRAEIKGLREEVKKVRDTAFELGVLVRVYEYRMKAAGISLDVEAQAKVHIAVYYQIVERLSLEDLKTAVFLLDEEGVKWDDVEGDTITSKAQGLVGKLERRGVMGKFLRIVRQEFPFVPWPADSGEITPLPPSPPPPKPRPRI